MRVMKHWNRLPTLIPGNIHSQVGWGFEQLGLVEDIIAHCRGVGLDDLQRSLPTQHIL